MESALARVKGKVTPISQEEIQALLDKSAQLEADAEKHRRCLPVFDKEIEYLKKARKKLLPVEARLRNAIDSRIAEVDRKRHDTDLLSVNSQRDARLNKTRATILAKYADLSYLCLPTAVLREADERGYPCFALLPVFSEEPFLLGIYKKKDERTVRAELAVQPQSLPYALRGQYDDFRHVVEHEMQKRTRDAKSFYLSASLPGYIPTNTKARIKAASEHFTPPKSRIFILMKVIDWETEFTAPASTSDPDPLVVGWDPDVPDLFFLIDTFDLTPLEEALVSLAKPPQ